MYLLNSEAFPREFFYMKEVLRTKIQFENFLLRTIYIGHGTKEMTIIH